MLSVLCFNIYAATNKQQAASIIESAYLPTSSAYTVTTTPTNQVPWSDLDVSITNQWQLVIKSKSAYNIQKISLTIDGTTLSNNVDIKLKPNVPATYFFYDVKLGSIVQQIISGYKFLGVYRKITGDDFSGFNNLLYKKIQVTISWLDNANNYNQATTNYMMVITK